MSVRHNPGRFYLVSLVVIISPHSYRMLDSSFWSIPRMDWKARMWFRIAPRPTAFLFVLSNVEGKTRTLPLRCPWHRLRCQSCLPGAGIGTAAATTENRPASQRGKLDVGKQLISLSMKFSSAWNIYNEDKGVQTKHPEEKTISRREAVL